MDSEDLPPTYEEAVKSSGQPIFTLSSNITPLPSYTYPSAPPLFLPVTPLPSASHHTTSIQEEQRQQRLTVTSSFPRQYSLTNNVIQSEPNAINSRSFCNRCVFVYLSVVFLFLIILSYVLFS